MKLVKKYSLYLSVSSCAILLSACGGSSGSKTAIDGEYALTGASCDGSFSSRAAASILRDSTSAQPSYVLKIGDGDFKIVTHAANCEVSVNYSVSSDDGKSLIVSGGSVESKDDTSACASVKSTLEKSIPKGDKLKTDYEFKAPVLNITNPSTKACNVFIMTKDTKNATAEIPADLESWLGNYAVSGYATCTSISDTSVGSYPSGVSRNSINLAGGSVTVIVSKSMSSPDYGTCTASITFPVSSSSSSSLSYSDPTIQVEASSYSSSSESSSQTADASKCDSFKNALWSQLSTASHSNFQTGSSRLEFTDPVDGKCMVLTK